jgi:hypothetical protein
LTFQSSLISQSGLCTDGVAGDGPAESI